jgi:hypothetical protein
MASASSEDSSAIMTCSGSESTLQTSCHPSSKQCLTSMGSPQIAALSNHRKPSERRSFVASTDKHSDWESDVEPDDDIDLRLNAMPHFGAHGKKSPIECQGVCERRKQQVSRVNEATRDMPAECTAEKVSCKEAVLLTNDASGCNDTSVLQHVAHTNSIQTAANVKKERRVKRPCLFCGKFIRRLTRHLQRKHLNEDVIQHAMKQRPRERRKVFVQCRKEGIIKYNMSIIGERNAVLLRERRPRRGTEDPQAQAVVVCDKCKGVFSRSYFFRHKRYCVGILSTAPLAIPATLYFSPNKIPSEEFKKEILRRFISDEAGRLCQQDELIAMIGSKLYARMKMRRDKKIEVRKSVMSDMRKLANLLIHFRIAAEDHRRVIAKEQRTQKLLSIDDLFHRRNFEILEDALMAYTSRQSSNTDSDKPEATDKFGLMLSLYYLLVKVAKILRVYYLIREDRNKATDMVEFLEVLGYNKNNLIGNALYNNNKIRQTKLRRPDNLPDRKDLAKLRSYTVSQIDAILADTDLQWTKAEFIEVRDMCCSRLTLFNARRGGEPARLTLAEYTDACNKVWLDPSRIEAMPDAEKELFNDNLIMYQAGKGVNHLVPVLVPHDLVAALGKIADRELRKVCGVHEDNNYLFPTTTSSEGHISGWHCLSKVCGRAQIKPSVITATKIRHWVSTMYASLDIPESKRQAFYKHMGHSKHINENIYQAPQAEVEMLEVGRILKKFGE